ncbi:MAG: methylamine utilization protein [Sulfuricellaceae bacterium]|nr:methylamine utilization protein [Sulfuricellaceae bacterium]
MTHICTKWAAALFLLSSQVNAGSLEARVANSAGKAIEDAALVLEPVSGVVPERPAAATIEQQGREFMPFVTIVQTGAAIDFPNRDSVKHHVYSFSKAKTFELKLYAGQPAKPQIFDQAGEVALGCNIHDWMEAYVLVVNTPYFAKTVASGRATIGKVPPGRYNLKVWHPLQKKDVPQREIEIGATSDKLDLVIEVTPRIAKSRPMFESNSY